jgi:hypothetical protein
MMNSSIRFLNIAVLIGGQLSYRHGCWVVICKKVFLTNHYVRDKFIAHGSWFISRWALIFVVEARQRAEGRREEDFSLLIFVDIPSFNCGYLLSS